MTYTLKRRAWTMLSAVAIWAGAGPAGAQVVGLPAGLLPHDLSPIGMFLAADIVVKAVMIGLALASVLTWTVLLVKLFQINMASGRAHDGLVHVLRADSLAEAAAVPLPLRGAPATMLRAARAEWNRSAELTPLAGRDGLTARTASLLAVVQARAARRIARGTGLLASIGSTAPFVGLFGTVWGIMNSFIGISQAQTTNLAVVAPGIAEALLATAMGLIAAIPAVLFYNLFARRIGAYRAQLTELAAGIERLVSRDLDRFTAGGG